MTNSQLVNSIIDQYENHSKWNNEILGNESYRINENDYEEVGRQNIIDQAVQLEKQGLLKIKWVSGSRNFDIEKVIYPLSNMSQFCSIAKREPKYITIQKQLQEVQKLNDRIKSNWIHKYLDEEVLSKLYKGKENKDYKKSLLLYQCLEGLDKLDAPVFKRVFSKHILGNSKLFEKELQKSVIRIAKKYKHDIDDAMEDTEVLSQLYIQEYAQELSIKGSLRIKVHNIIIDTKNFIYGLVLNSETLKNAAVIDNPQIRKIVTIENKANFVAQAYEEGTLFIFTHGFFTPTEKMFLKKLYEKISNQKICYYHCGDMDYGGVQIFRYIKNNIFPPLVPYKMDVATFQKYYQYSEPITDSSWEKIKTVQEPLLQGLISFIITNKRVLEQESYI